MSLLDIRFLPDPGLREKAAPVTEITPAVLRLLDDMLETMYHADGIGLAAPQVGVAQRVIVMDVHAGKEDAALRRPMQMINPEIVAASEETSSYEEGCLSIPQMNGEVTRPTRVTVHYLDRDGNAQQIEATGLLATCIQHEIDHLNGTLFIDHLTPLKRNMLLRRYNKRQQDKS